MTDDERELLRTLARAYLAQGQYFRTSLEAVTDVERALDRIGGRHATRPKRGDMPLVGGPCDGERRSTPPGMQSLSIVIDRPQMASDGLGASHESENYASYRIATVTSSGVEVSFWRYIDLPIDQAIIRVFDLYGVI
jgi:hypothetical protein